MDLWVPGPVNPQRFFIALTGFLVALLSTTTARETQSLWLPPVYLRHVPVKEDCQQTRHRIGATLQPNLFYPHGVIFFCPERARAIDAANPGASLFFLVHEYGHLALNTRDEAAADDWAAGQLQNVPRGPAVLRAVVRHFLRAGRSFDPHYGSNLERARRVAVYGGWPRAQWPPELLRYAENRAQTERKGTTVRLLLPAGYLNEAELLLSVDERPVGFLSTDPPSGRLICPALGAGRHVLTATDVWLYHHDRSGTKKSEIARRLSASCIINPTTFTGQLELILRNDESGLELAADLDPP
ncbi:MAG TPA: hypothetical protein VGD78_13625 [Chthoniobacterales bacterium]